MYHTAEKNLVWEIADRPYRKPTQVDGENILRCSSEPWSRNSANWPRNFGISGVSTSEGLRAPKLVGIAVKWAKRLFNKNTSLCEVVKTTYRV